MKKNIGSQLALYPISVTVIDAVKEEKSTWTLFPHVGIIGHDRVLFRFPTCEYLRTGEVIGKCLFLKNSERV